MKHVLKTAALLLLSVLSVNTVFAQRNFDPQRMADRQTKMINEHISSLTGQQKTQVKELNEQYSKSMSDLWSNNSGDRQAMREKMQAMRKDRNEKLKAIFNEAQYKQYQQMEDSMRQNRGRGRGQGRSRSSGQQ
jgi:hypothetical protein